MEHFQRAVRVENYVFAARLAQSHALRCAIQQVDCVDENFVFGLSCWTLLRLASLAASCEASGAYAGPLRGTPRVRARAGDPTPRFFRNEKS